VDSEQAVCELVLRYDQYVLMDWTIMKHYNWLWQHQNPFLYSTCVQCLGWYHKVEYTDANLVIWSESHNICIQYMQHDLDNTFQGCIPSFLKS
jgi:hypothetical protein